MADQRHRNGRRAEHRACHYLEQQGYVLVANNVHLNNRRGMRGELDLIMLSPRGSLVFVEVRSSTRTPAAELLHSINRNKRQQLRRLATAYLGSQPQLPRQWDEIYFDVVAVSGPPRDSEIVHIADAFRMHDEGV